MVWGCQTEVKAANLTDNECENKIQSYRTPRHDQARHRRPRQVAHYVGRQIDGATPQPVQKMTFEGLLRFVAKQQSLAREVFT